MAEKITEENLAAAKEQAYAAGQERERQDAAAQEAERAFEEWHARCCKDCDERCQHKEWEREAYRRGRAEDAASGKLDALMAVHVEKVKELEDKLAAAEQREKRLREAAAEHLRQCEGPGWNPGAHLEAMEKLRAALAGEKK